MKRISLENNQLDLRNQIQHEAVDIWVKNGKKGTLEMITGIGKTFCALHALHTMPNDKTHLFLAETTQRQKDLFEDIDKYDKIFKTKTLNKYKLEFACYQSAYKWKNLKFGLVIADEIHDSLTPSYKQFFDQNTYDAIIGLSATVNRKTEYEINNKKITKGDFIDQIAPVVFKYDINSGQRDDLSRDLNIYVINHKLDAFNKTIKAGNAKKTFYQSETAAYAYWDKLHKQSWYLPDLTIKESNAKRARIAMTSRKRADILYNLESKVEPVKKLLSVLNRTILFGNSIHSLLKVTPNVVSSDNSDSLNEKIRKDFDEGKIQTIGSFKMLKQGANLKDLDNVVIMSYYSTEKDLIQRLGRLRNKKTKGNVFIFVTQQTQEEVWFNKMFKDIDSLKLIYCPNVEFCINKLNE